MSIFTGNINLLCTSNMMIAMVLFACVSPLSLTPPHVATHGRLTQNNKSRRGADG